MVDEQDRVHLSKMNEIDREIILDQRRTKREQLLQRYALLKQKQQEISKPRPMMISSSSSSSSSDSSSSSEPDVVCMKPSLVVKSDKAIVKIDNRFSEFSKLVLSRD